MSSQQLQSSNLKMTSRNLRLSAPTPLASKPLRPLAPKHLATTPLAAPKPLALRPLAPKRLVTTPLVPKPLTPKPTPIPLSQDQDSSNEMEVNSNFFFEYETTEALMIPNEKSAYSLQENIQENYFYEDIPLDILNVERESFNAEDQMVNIKFY